MMTLPTEWKNNPNDPNRQPVLYKLTINKLNNQWNHLVDLQKHQT